MKGNKFGIRAYSNINGFIWGYIPEFILYYCYGNNMNCDIKRYSKYYNICGIRINIINKKNERE
jgi:hypothetical protein